MGAKRKRPARSSAPLKRTKVESVTDLADEHPVLKRYFDNVSSLRDHLIRDLEERAEFSNAAQRIRDEHETPVAELLDNVIVGARSNKEKLALRERRAKDIVCFTQQLPSSTIGSHHEISTSAQLEVVDFLVWLVFKRNPPPSRPQHMLAQGFDRFAATGQNGIQLSAVPGIPGIICRYSNPHVEFVTSTPWCRLLMLFGKGGDAVMVDLLLECWLFQSISSSNSRGLHQFSGTPLSALQPLKSEALIVSGGSTGPISRASKTLHNERAPSSIKFVRNRMFFAQPSLSSNGRVRFGLHSIHVLNRFSNLESERETTHILMHLFPRLFRLHNVFTSAVDPRESALPFKDYTLRETEIKRQLMNKDGELDATKQVRIPKRLQGKPVELVNTLRRLHAKCQYHQLLKHYCELSADAVQFLQLRVPPARVTDLAMPISRVSAFCQAVIKRVIPRAIFGDGDAGKSNTKLLLKRVDTFLRARKFESFTLQSFLDGLKISAVSWTCLPHQEGHKMSQSDYRKRKELVAEFVYYLFDSYLIPLVRSNFHVTESNAHRNRLFYFRHDVWQALCDPALADLKERLFEELDNKSTKQRLAERTFGYSKVRLLPKTAGFRPIANLKRRPYVWIGGRRVLGKSINSALNPAFRALNFEKSTNLDRLGCSLFSVAEIHSRLKAYLDKLAEIDKIGLPLYFAKVDVQACFDTIPQTSVLKLVTDMVQNDEYIVANEARVKVPEVERSNDGIPSINPVVKYTSAAKPSDFFVETTGANSDDAHGSSVLVKPLGQQAYRQEQIQKLIKEHVEFNLIKIGRKYYRQKDGIPQGSILSSLLCNLFYGKLEHEELPFLQRSDTLLLRLIDDFLLISTERRLAEKFVRVMHKGISEYGVSVKPAKSLTNFECSTRGEMLARTEGTGFPYCGLMINMSTLEVSKNPEGKPGVTTSDSLTVEYSTMPGRTFRRKALNALKIQCHSMYFDTSFNSLDTALSNLYRLFHDSAKRIESYIRALPKRNAPPFETVKSTIEDLIQLAYTMIRRKRGKKDKDYECAIRRNQAVCIACRAFEDVFAPRQTKNRVLLDWLRRTVKLNWPREGRERNALLRMEAFGQRELK